METLTKTTLYLNTANRSAGSHEQALFKLTKGIANIQKIVVRGIQLYNHFDTLWPAHCAYYILENGSVYRITVPIAEQTGVTPSFSDLTVNGNYLSWPQASGGGNTYNWSWFAADNGGFAFTLTRASGANTFSVYAGTEYTDNVAEFLGFETRTEAAGVHNATYIPMCSFENWTTSGTVVNAYNSVAENSMMYPPSIRLLVDWRNRYEDRNVGNDQFCIGSVSSTKRFNYVLLDPNQTNEFTFSNMYLDSMTFTLVDHKDRVVSKAADNHPHLYTLDIYHEL